MTRPFALVCCGMILLLCISGCLSFIQDNSGLPTQEDEEAVLIDRVYEQAILTSNSPYPLFVGAEWIYRNATNDFNPEVHPSSILTKRILATVLCVDPETQEAWECFVTQSSDPLRAASTSYLFRSQEGIYQFSSKLRDPSSAFPGFLLVPFPITQDTYVAYNVPKFEGTALWDRAEVCIGNWNLRKTGSEGDCPAGSNVVFLSIWYDQEMVGLSKDIHSVLGAYTSILTNAWKLELYPDGIDRYPNYQWWTTVPDSTWLAPGVGPVKWVKGSNILELIQYVDIEEILHLSEDSGTEPHNIDVGARIVFKFRGSSPDGANPLRWRLLSIEGKSPNGGEDKVVASRELDAFYHDITTDGEALDSGTYVYEYEAITEGYVTFQFNVARPEDDSPPLVFHIKVGDFDSLP